MIRDGWSTVKCVLDLFLSKAMAGKLRIVTEQKTLCKNLTTLQKSMVWIHQQQCGLALRTMSKGTQTRLAQIPEQARFLMNLLVTDLNTVVRQVDHNTMKFPSSEPMKMTTCTVVVNWRYSCASPNSPSALRLAPAASAPDALRGSLALREIQLPLCPMARLGLRLRWSQARPLASDPRAQPLLPRARRDVQVPDGVLENPGQPRVPSRLHPASPGAWEAGREEGEAAPHSRALLGACQQPHEGGNDQSPPSVVRPSSWVLSEDKPTRQRWKYRRRHLTVKEGALRSRCPLQLLLLPPPEGRGIPPESPRLTGSAPLLRGKKTFG